MTLSDLDPNVAALLVGAGISLVTFLWNKARGIKQDNLADVVSGLVDQGLHLAIVTADSDPTALRTEVTSYAWVALAKAKVPRNATSELLVNAAIEVGIAAALREARAHDKLVASQIAANIATAQAGVPAMMARQAELDAAGAKADAAYAKMLAATAPDPVTPSGNPTIVVVAP